MLKTYSYIVVAMLTISTVDNSKLEKCYRGCDDLARQESWTLETYNMCVSWCTEISKKKVKIEKSK